MTERSERLSTPESTDCSAPQSVGGFSRRELLQIGALGLIGAWPGLAAGGLQNVEALAGSASPSVNPAAPITLACDEPADRPPGAIDWPVTAGVPFADGQLTDVSELSIIAGDRAVPAQFTEALRWRRGAKTISWVHCDYQVRLGKGALGKAALHRGATKPAPVRGVTVVDDGGHITVDTGAISFRCSKTAFNLFDSLAAGDKQLVRSSTLYWRDTQGVTYEAKHVVDQVVVEKSGPLRAVLRYEGWYQNDRGSKKLRYQVWIHAFAGLPYVRIYDKLIWTENLVLYVTIDQATNRLTTKSVFADRAGVESLVAHGWSTGDMVKWTFSHSDIDAAGASQYYDNTSKQGSQTVVLPRVDGTALDRDTSYFVRRTSDTSFTLHRSAADAHSGARPIKFLDQGLFSKGGVTFGGRHYLEAQHPVLAEWGITFHLAAPATQASIDLAGSAAPRTIELSTVASLSAVQSEPDVAQIKLAGQSGEEVGSLAGWAEARMAEGAGVAVAVKGLGVQNPKALVIDARTISLKLWGGTPMSLAEQDRVLPEYAERGYPKEWLAFSGEPNPVGISKTHEIWVWPTRSVAENRLINDLVQRPVACCPDPQYACSTNYVLQVRARSQTPPELNYVEEALENLLRNLTARDALSGDYDEWNYGDLRLFRAGSFRTWDNGGYNGSDLLWWQWYRSGRRFFLEEGMNNARHVMDVDTMAHSQTVTGGYNTYQRIAGRTQVFATLHWAWPAAHGDLFNDFPSYLLLCWLMTGYEVARTVLETKCRERAEASYGDPGDPKAIDLARVSREQYGAAAPKFVYYEFTGEERFYQAGRKILQIAIAAQQASSESAANGARLFPNNNYWGFFYEGFLQAYRYQPEPALLAALAQLVSDFAVDVPSQFAAPNWQCTWPAPTRMGRSRNSLIPFAAAYQHTQDQRYFHYPVDRIMRQCRTVQPAPPELGFDSIAGLLGPAFVRDAIMILGTWQDAGRPAINWLGNLPFFASRSTSAAPWVAQLTLWVQKAAGRPGRIRLIFKDTNLTSFELPGRVQAVILDPAGTSRNILLSKTVGYPAKISASGVSVNGAKLATGQPVRFSATGKLPTPLVAGATYYVRVVASAAAATTVSLHRSLEEARSGIGPLKLSGGSGPLTLAVSTTTGEAHIALAADAPAGAYRIHVQSEASVFRVSPATDLPGMVVELGGVNDLRLDATLGPAEYHFRMRPGRETLTLSTSDDQARNSQALAVLSARGDVLGRFQYDDGATISQSLEIPAADAAGMLRLAKGSQEFSPRVVNSLPFVRLAGAERYVAVTPEQWFSPLAAFNESIAAFWSLDEERGPRADATGNGRDLKEVRGPIGSESGGPLGSAALLAAPGNAWLTCDDATFQAASSFTVWGWVRLDQLQESRYLFVKGGDVAGNPASGEWAVYVLPKPGRIFFQARAGKKYAFTPGLPFVVDRKVHFVIAWYDAQQKKIMLQVDNGQIVSQVLGGPMNVGREPLGVGGSAANGRGWIGTIAAVGFARRVLTPLERDLLYNGGAGGQFPF